MAEPQPSPELAEKTVPWFLPGAGGVPWPRCNCCGRPVDGHSHAEPDE